MATKGSLLNEVYRKAFGTPRAEARPESFPWRKEESSEESKQPAEAEEPALPLQRPFPQFPREVWTHEYFLTRGQFEVARGRPHWSYLDWDGEHWVVDNQAIREDELQRELDQQQTPPPLGLPFGPLSVIRPPLGAGGPSSLPKSKEK